jgi:Protein of unknown function (DUF1688)
VIRRLPRSNQSRLDYWRDPIAIRDRATQLYELAQQDQLADFQLDPDRWEAVTDYVEQVTRQAYPDLVIPFHSRWRHFPADRLATVCGGLSGIDRVKAQIDLVIPSVLLDAGAGDQWTYVDTSGQSWQRSQGLAVASLELFEQGLFSAAGDRETDGQGLRNVTLAQLAAGLQVSDRNPLPGLAGRLALLHRLGDVLLSQPLQFGPTARLGNLLDDWLVMAAPTQSLSAATMLHTLLATFGEIWPSRHQVAGVNLGDVWTHPQLPIAFPDEAVAYVPFHKLSQWLTYSLLEPLQELGLNITEIDRLTGLAEYRNGGLFLDLGLLRLRDATIAAVPQPPQAAVMVEWRGLTIALLDQLADRLRQRWGMDARQLPLVKVLQGGTWAAGRAIALERRADGSPPLRLLSDGTVF